MSTNSNAPVESSAAEFRKTLRQHTSIAHVSDDEREHTVRATTVTGLTVRIRLASAYTIGVADVREIIDSDSGCPVESTIQAVGRRWKVLVIHHLLEGTQWFGELTRLLHGV